MRYRLQRTDDSETSLQCVYIHSNKEEEEPLAFHMIHLGMHDYFSLATRVGSEADYYVICRYEFDGDDRGNIYLMDDSFVIEQIESGKIDGRVDRDDGRITGVLLEATGEELKKFVGRHGDKVFDLKHPLACKRIGISVAQE